MVFNPLHYLPLIERKIMALDQAAPLQGWELPKAFDTLQRLLEARQGKTGKRKYVQVLRLLERFEMDELHVAIKTALHKRAISFDAVKHLVLCRVERRPPRLDLDVYPFLPRTNVATTSASSFRAFALEVDRGTEPKTTTARRKSYANSIDLYRKMIERELARKHYGLKAPLLVLWVFTSRTNEARFLEMLAVLPLAIRKRFLTRNTADPVSSLSKINAKILDLYQKPWQGVKGRVNIGSR